MTREVREVSNRPTFTQFGPRAPCYFNSTCWPAARRDVDSFTRRARYEVSRNNCSSFAHCDSPLHGRALRRRCRRVCRWSCLRGLVLGAARHQTATRKDGLFVHYLVMVWLTIRWMRLPNLVRSTDARRIAPWSSAGSSAPIGEPLAFAFTDSNTGARV